MISYLDTSAVAKLIVLEAESSSVQDHLDRVADRGGALRSSILLETELRRLAIRDALPQRQVSRILDGIDLIEAERAHFQIAAGFGHRHLGTLDALHLACAVQVGADELVTYDRRLAEAAAEVGIVVAAPA
ncbi:MAG: type II toxin-antitoxin system VapC family toxin [Acidimicrobiales bacterium]|nr:type II toxin-antitoxin system VapC family toxin [Acidimicrobiales bacterium]